MTSLSIKMLIFVTTASTIFIGALEAATQPEANTFNWVEVVRTKLSTQVSFDFVNKCTCSREIIEDKNQFNIIFHNVEPATFNTNEVFERLSVLKERGIVKTIEIFKHAQQKNCMVVSLHFATQLPESDGSSQGGLNKFLIKWNVLQKPHRLVLNIFTDEDLQTFMKTDTSVRLASNNSVLTDYKPSLAYAGAKKKTLNRIMIDPGHGGSDTGTKNEATGVMEKDLALDIARYVAQMLKKKGFDALLTRDRDVDVALGERIEMASDNDADFFVSIHVNSAGLNNPKAHGIETFYCDNSDTNINPSTGFIFINMHKDKALAEKIVHRYNKVLKESQTLATNIQNNLIATLSERFDTINNRGAKKEKFRLLVPNYMPTALVEVGFLTNPLEAKRLETPSYRKIVAQGICSGIIAYAQQH
jgi:N-acetylmuramoyl-L-alanine amidase